MVKPRRDDLVILKELIESGKVKTVIEKVYPIEEVKQAHIDIETGRTKGKIVLSI